MATDCSDRDTVDAVPAVLAWYAAHRRDLPWRAADRTPWGVLVSEVMLQQTQVSRVLPKWTEAMQRWPTPGDLAATATADVLRMWQGLGYPRRALRLRAAAQVIVDVHGGAVPDQMPELRALPGIGEYTAAAVLAFAFGRRVAVLDTNVRRVLARWRLGLGSAPGSGISAAERELAEDLLPGDELAPVWSVALMELGALTCTARTPRCGDCPIRATCRWRAAGYPQDGAESRRQPRFEGSDRQARGVLLAQVLAAGRVPERVLLDTWSGSGEQAARALASLLADGLLRREDGWILADD